MANVTIDIDLDDDVYDGMIDLIINDLSSASQEVFQQIKDEGVCHIEQAVGKAVINEIIITAVKVGMEMDPDYQKHLAEFEANKDKEERPEEIEAPPLTILKEK